MAGADPDGPPPARRSRPPAPGDDRRRPAPHVPRRPRRPGPGPAVLLPRLRHPGRLRRLESPGQLTPSADQPGPAGRTADVGAPGWDPRPELQLIPMVG